MMRAGKRAPGGPGPGRRTWLFGLALCVSAVLLLAPPLSVPIRAHICAPDPELGAGGTLLVPSGSGLSAISLEDRSARSVPVLPASGVVTHVARAPAGDRLAVARFARAANEPIGGADILLTGPDGGLPLLTIARQRPGELLAAPAWLPNGGLVFERSTTSGPSGGPRIERVEPDGSGRRVVLERATSPAVSPDGSLLAFVRSEPSDRLLVRPLDGEPERPIVDDPSLLVLAFPRFSPDGNWIAFSAVADPSLGLLPSGGAAGSAWLLPGAGQALAHGLPWDVWLVRPDGTDLRRVTNFYDDDPAIAWSPDGQRLAIYAGESIKLVSPNDLSTVCVLDRGGYGGFEWI